MLHKKPPFYKTRTIPFYSTNASNSSVIRRTEDKVLKLGSGEMPMKPRDPLDWSVGWKKPKARTLEGFAYFGRNNSFEVFVEAGPLKNVVNGQKKRMKEKDSTAHRWLGARTWPDEVEPVAGPDRSRLPGTAPQWAHSLTNVLTHELESRCNEHFQSSLIPLIFQSDNNTESHSCLWCFACFPHFR